MNYPLRQMSKFIATQNKIVSTIFSSGLQIMKTIEVMQKNLTLYFIWDSRNTYAAEC